MEVSFMISHMCIGAWTGIDIFITARIFHIIVIFAAVFKTLIDHSLIQYFYIAICVTVCVWGGGADGMGHMCGLWWQAGWSLRLAGWEGMWRQ